MSDAEAIHWLVERVPELQSLHDDHVEGFDELLPYVLFESDFTPWFAAEVRSGVSEAVKRFCGAIELLVATPSKVPSDDPVWNLAAVAFIEALVMGGDDDVIDRAFSCFGSRTVHEFRRMRRYRDGHDASFPRPGSN